MPDHNAELALALMAHQMAGAMEECEPLACVCGARPPTDEDGDPRVLVDDVTHRWFAEHQAKALVDAEGGTARHGSYLTRPQLWALDEACKPLVATFGPPMLVGSVLERPDFRDVDLRMILTDHVYDLLEDPQWALLSFVTSSHLAAVTGLPIDFQFQRMTEANAAYPGKLRNPMGLRGFDRDWVGNARPEPHLSPERCPECGVHRNANPPDNPGIPHSPTCTRIPPQEHAPHPETRACPHPDCPGWGPR